ncbi:MAG: MHYT domain-containing protein, partial [Gemmatimonadota bacterium]|nr:MHYT domain-containing protein [Gemmatimonadota bacterium]
MTPDLAHLYSVPLVVLSIAIAMLASYTALDLAGRVHVAAGRARTLWIAGGGIAMGTGIWTMHFVGMLALRLPMPVDYDGVLVTLSIVVAIGASAFALHVASRERAAQGRLAVAGVAMGVAIAGMHYIGMAAMRMAAAISYRMDLWWASVAIAVAASYVALHVARALGTNESGRVHVFRAAAAVVMGFAIAGMHYTGMAAARFTPMAHDTSDVAPISPFTLVIAVATGGTLVLGFGLLAGMVDRLIQARTADADLRAARDAAERMNRAKSEFLSNMSHELRTPLNSVIGFANVLLKNRNRTLGAQDVAYLERIGANGRHLLGLINGILDLSKIEAGRVDLAIAPVDVSTLVRDTVLELEGQTHGRDVRLVADVPDVLAPVDTDATRLKQILINLVGNALKFTSHGTVTVRVVRDETSGRLARIDVIDTGIGIPAHRLDAVFEAFQQADSGPSRQYGGTGLGLTITRSLAQVMGFDITVESTVGAGSTFSVVARPWEGAPHAAARRAGQAAAAGDAA